MTRAIAYLSATMFLAAFGCDATEPGGPDDSTEFRQNISYVQVQTQTASYSSKGCDPDWWFVEEFGEEEWMAMIHTQGRMIGDEMLVRTFLAQPESANLCLQSCREGGARWTGDVRVVDSSHEFGETELGEECAARMIATATPTESVGEIACACAI